MQRAFESYSCASWGEVTGSWGELDYREAILPHPEAKFGHFVGDVEAKLGYGRSC